MATTEAIEARSLSSLTTIAANPPQYPRNPTHVQHEPVVLYIARVPGSRDVFLSPMKPRDKVVSAEDVQSSLYYLHINQADDARLLEPPHSNDARYSSDLSDNDTLRPSGETVLRKPVLPSRPPSYATLAPEPPIHRKLPAYSPPRSPTKQYQDTPLATRAESTSNSNVPFAALNRKPLPPPRNQGNGFAENAGLVGRENTVPRRPLVPTSENTHPNHAVPTSTFAKMSVDGPERQRETPHNRSGAASAPNNMLPNETGSTVTLTLIRRDPASGAQWNVAEISDPPILDVGSEQRNSKNRRAGAPMYLAISNPGYSKFLHSDEEPLVNGRPSVELGSGRSSPTKALFQRRLWMEGARSADQGFGHTRTGSTEIYSSPRNNIGQGPGNPTEQTYDAAPIIKQTSFRGYAFTSPWSTRCEFSTGVGGGSLKCTHIVPDAFGAASRLAPATVSELRFNLPSSVARPSTRTPGTPDEDKKSKRSSLFSRSRDSRASTAHSHGLSLSWQHTPQAGEKLDLSLGQESAGGGFGGKQAKLGKLILEDEGLKMMDLLVAANMALWWRAYERTDKR